MNGKIAVISVLVVLGILMSSGLVAANSGGVPPPHADPTKIVPTDGAEPSHPFTIIDTGQARLTNGCKAVFKLEGSETVVDLRTHKPYKTTRGIVPDIGGGDYTVFVRQADGTEFEIGLFTIIGAPAFRPPFMEPAEGPPGTPFTITDDKGRMASADRIIFAISGTGPEAGTLVTNPEFLDGGETAKGAVPGVLAPGLFYDVTVHSGDPTVNPPLFNSFMFFVN